MKCLLGLAALAAVANAGCQVYQNVYQVVAFGCIRLHTMKEEIGPIRPISRTGCVSLHPQ